MIGYLMDASSGYLRSKNGTGSQWVDTLGPIKIGAPTLLPAIISKDTILNAKKSPYLVKDALIVLPGRQAHRNARHGHLVSQTWAGGKRRTTNYRHGS